MDLMKENRAWLKNLKNFQPDDNDLLEDHIRNQLLENEQYLNLAITKKEIQEKQEAEILARFWILIFIMQRGMYRVTPQNGTLLLFTF